MLGSVGVGNEFGGKGRPGEVRRQVIPMACTKNERNQLDFGERSVDGDQTHGLWNEVVTGGRAQIHTKLGSPEHVTVPSLSMSPKSSENQKTFFCNSVGIMALTDMRLFIMLILLSETVYMSLCINIDVFYYLVLLYYMIYNLHHKNSALQALGFQKKDYGPVTDHIKLVSSSLKWG